MTTAGTSAAEHVWCWRCGEKRGPADSYLHRADTPVLAHDRCSVCNDVLMPYPQPSVAEKIAQLATHLEQAFQLAHRTTTNEPSEFEAAALTEIREHLTAARRVYFRRLDPRIPEHLRREE